MKNLLKLSSLLIVFAIFFMGCEEPVNTDPETSKNVYESHLAVSDVFSFTVKETSKEKSDADSSCYTVEYATEDSTMFTTTITFNENCTLSDGIVRKGQIIISGNGDWLNIVNEEVTVTFNEYSMDGKDINGELKFKLVLSGDKPKFIITENNMSLKENNKTTTWSGTNTIVWEEGYLTILDFNDDVLSITVNKEGVGTNGNNYTATGTVYTKNCTGKAEITKGVVTIVENGGETAVDFGDGNCDGAFTVNGIPINL